MSYHAWPAETLQRPEIDLPIGAGVVIPFPHDANPPCVTLSVLVDPSHQALRCNPAFTHDGHLLEGGNMKKLKLDLNDLRIDSFETSHARVRDEGTVFGQTDTVNCATEQFTCSPDVEEDTPNDCDATLAPQYLGCTAQCAYDSEPGWQTCGGCTSTNNDPGCNTYPIGSTDCSAHAC